MRPMRSIPITARGAEKLRAELQRLRGVDRPSIIQAIKDAREKGDLTENAEYDAARERQGFVEGRIQELEGKLSALQIIDPDSGCRRPCCFVQPSSSKIRTRAMSSSIRSSATTRSTLKRAGFRVEHDRARVDRQKRRRHCDCDTRPAAEREISIVSVVYVVRKPVPQRHAQRAISRHYALFFCRALPLVTTDSSALDYCFSRSG